MDSECMNILFITDNFYPEGNAIASRVYERACYWVKWGHHVTVITSAPNFPEGKLYLGYKNKWIQKEKLQGIDVTRVKTFIYSNKGFFLRIIDFLSFMPLAFFVGLFQKKPDIVATTSPQFFGAIAACFVAKCKRVPFLLELGDLWPASIVGVGAMRDSAMIRLLEKIELSLYRHSNQIVAVSPAFKNNLISRQVDAKKISVIMNGVDLLKYAPRSQNEALKKKYNIQQNHFVVGYIGTHGMAHGLENILESAQRLRHNKDILFIFVGMGSEKEALIEKSKVMRLDNVQFIPEQSKEVIADYWSLCHVALVHFRNAPIFSTAIPSKIFEAMGMGLPILLSSPMGIARDIILSEKIGLWVPAENPKALAEAIDDWYQHPEAFSQFAKMSLAAAIRYTRETQSRLFLTAMEKIKTIFLK